MSVLMNVSVPLYIKSNNLNVSARQYRTFSYVFVGLKKYYVKSEETKSNKIENVKFC